MYKYIYYIYILKFLFLTLGETIWYLPKSLQIFKVSHYKHVFIVIIVTSSLIFNSLKIFPIDFQKCDTSQMKLNIKLDLANVTIKKGQFSLEVLIRKRISLQEM